MREGWTYKKLGEVAKLINGFAFQSAMFQKAGLPIVRISNIQDDKITSDFVYFNRDDYNIDFEKFEVLYGDILIAMSGATTGKVGINYNDEVLYLNQRVGKIVPRENVIQRYLFYYLKTNAAKSLSIAQGVAQPNLSTQQINSFVLPVPPLSEQQRIVSELDLLSSIIEKKKAQLKEYDQLAQSIFYDMFGDPVTNEKGWEVKKLGEVCETTSGGTPSKNHPEYYEGGMIPWLRSGEVCQGFIYNTEMFITEEGLKCSSAKMIPVNSVAIAMYGATVGQVGIIKTPLCTNQAICSILPNNHFVPIFLYHFLLSKKNDFLKVAVGGAQPNISQAVIKQTIIGIPPLSLQQSFASKIEAIEHQKALVQQSITETESLFNSRMDYYFD